LLRVGIQSARDEPLPEETDRIFSSINQFAAALPVHSLTLLQSIARAKPETLEQLAQLTGLPIEGVYQKIKALKGLGIITILGRHPQRPILAYDGMTLELVFAR
jgi:predicted transcriptional regulator